jgi:hypothetical protein
MESSPGVQMAGVAGDAELPPQTHPPQTRKPKIQKKAARTTGRLALDRQAVRQAALTGRLLGAADLLLNGRAHLNEKCCRGALGCNGGNGHRHNSGCTRTHPFVRWAMQAERPCGHPSLPT